MNTPTAPEGKFNVNHWIVDLETYKNCFTLGIVRADGKFPQVFEVSDRKNETVKIMNCLRYLSTNKQSMVGFNNRGFDYPILHEIMQLAIKAKRKGEDFEFTARIGYDLAQKQIDSFKDGFGSTVNTSEELIRQIDLFKIHHFDNKAKSTSLKMIEFNMRSETIEDLPYSPHKNLTSDQMDEIVKYNLHDVMKTLEFYWKSYDMITFREQLGAEVGLDFTNHSDSKIGGDYFINMLEKNKPGTCYKMQGHKRVTNRTVRKNIVIKDCLFDYYDFERPEFIAIKDWFSRQVITETKGVFSDIPEHLLYDVAKYANLVVKRIRIPAKTHQETLQELQKQYPMGWVEEETLQATENVLDEMGEVVRVQNEKGRWVNLKQNKKSYWFCYKIATSLNVLIDGFEVVFGVGGIHASLESEVVHSDENYVLLDADVSSMYPNIAISNRVYPEHLGEKFCDIYQEFYNQRKQYSKGTAKNLAIKLGLNSVYGNSNNEFSPFFDSKYTMQITINGQLSLCLLGEKLKKAIPDLQFIQWNTDGMTCKLNRKDVDKYKEVCNNWQDQVGLQLEFVEYKSMYIRDVNNYIGVYEDGKLKRKGAYEYENLGWHQNQSALVIQKAVEANLIRGEDVRTFIENHEDIYDFMLRTKVPRSSRLVLEYEDGLELPLQNICRYYPSKKGGKLVKIMPALAGKEEGGDRRLGIDKNWNVRVCNNMQDFKGDIDFDYYVSEAEKLISLQNPEDKEN